MVMSGVVKLTSGDDSWVGRSFLSLERLTALDYHYWSQPLPTVFAWWADKQSGMVQEFLGRVLSLSSKSSCRFSSGRRAACA